MLVPVRFFDSAIGCSFTRLLDLRKVHTEVRHSLQVACRHDCNACSTLTLTVTAAAITAMSLKFIWPNQPHIQCNCNAHDHSPTVMINDGHHSVFCMLYSRNHYDYMGPILYSTMLYHNYYVLGVVVVTCICA